MLHGWLDNCRSFWKLAPDLVVGGGTKNCCGVEIVAMDFPGHGQSSHKSLDGPSVVLAEGAYYVGEVLHQLKWNDNDDNDNKTTTTTTTIVGHSMGSAVAMLYTAAFPEQVDNLVLLEGIGPLPRHEQDVHRHVRAHVEKRLSQNRQSRNRNRLYPSLHDAVQRRIQSARNAPGHQDLSYEAAHEIVKRGTIHVNNKSDAVRFRHDSRLLWPSLLYTTHAQASAIQKAVAGVRTCLVVAKENGWPLFPHQDEEALLANLQPRHFAKLEGSHHFHADPDTYQAVAQHVWQFLFSGDSPPT